MSQFQDFGNALVTSVTDVVGDLGDNFSANVDINKAKAAVILNNAAIAQQQAKLASENSERNHKLLKSVVVGALLIVALAVVLNFVGKYLKK